MIPAPSTIQPFDVAVIGGGSAGMAAAVCAARAGAATILLERQGYLGGMATSALVHSVCGLYLLRDEAGAEYANPGFPREFAERLLLSGAAQSPRRMGRLDVLLHHPAEFALAADRLVREEKNLTVRFHTEVLALDAAEQGFRIETTCRSSRESFFAKSLVDSSGDAVAAHLAEFPTERTAADRLQRPAYIFGLGGVPSACLEDEGRLRLSHSIVEGLRAGRLSREAMGAHFLASTRPGEAFCTIDLPGQSWEHDAYDPLNPECLTALEFTGREIAAQLVSHFRAAVPELSGCHVTHWPARAGIRESRSAITQHVLTEDDLLSGKSFDDGIALATWPLEIRERTTGPKWRFPQGPKPPQIPLRSLVAEASDRFFVAGRCMGATHEAQASIRVMGTCMATGEAAGIAAAIRASDNEATAPQIQAIRERITR